MKESSILQGVAQKGRVLQVVSTTKTDTFSASVVQGAETAITGLAATITPSSTSSKIWVVVSVTLGNTASNQAAEYFTMFRDSTAIGRGDAASTRQRVTGTGVSSATGNETFSVGGNHLDEPATSSPVTYSVKVSHARAATTTAYVNRSYLDADQTFGARAVSSITLMEVAG